MELGPGDGHKQIVKGQIIIFSIQGCPELQTIFLIATVVSPGELKRHYFKNTSLYKASDLKTINHLTQRNYEISRQGLPSSPEGGLARGIVLGTNLT